MRAFFLVLAISLNLLSGVSCCDLWCSSCASCQTILESAESEHNTTCLMNDISITGDCVSLSSISNRRFDCQGHMITGSYSGRAVYLSHSHYFELENCTIRYFGQSLYISQSSYVVMKNSVLNHAKVYCVSSFSPDIIGNHFSNSVDRVVEINSCSNPYIHDNEIQSGTTGIYLVYPHNSVISKNIIRTVSEYGIFVIGSVTNVTLYRNEIEYTTQHSIYLKKIQDSLVTENVVKYSSNFGIYAYDSSSSSIISNNNVTFCGEWGILIDSSCSNMNLSSNEICYNKFDTHLHDIPTNGEENNICDYGSGAVSCSESCRYLNPTDIQCECSSCDDCTEKMTYSKCKEIHVNSSSVYDDSSHCIDGSLTTYGFHGKTLDCGGNVFQGVQRSSMGVYLYQKNSVTIRNCTFNSFRHGIKAERSLRIDIIDSTFQSNWYKFISSYYYVGVILYKSDKSRVKNCKLSNNVIDVNDSPYSTLDGNEVMYPSVYTETKNGISVKYSEHTILRNNHIEHIYDTGIYININQVNITLENNRIIDAKTGIFLKTNSESMIIMNTIKEMSERGINCEGCTNCQFVGNNISDVEQYGMTFSSSSSGNSFVTNRIRNSRYKGLFLDSSCTGNEVLSNMACYHGKDIELDVSTNVVENNTCDHIFITSGGTSSCANECYRVEDDSPECICNDCSDCSDKLVYSSECSKITMNGSSLDTWVVPSGSCINPSASYGFVHKTLDCNGINIQGTGDKGIYIYKREYVTILNCTVRSFSEGIVSEHSNDVRFLDNRLISNSYLFGSNWYYTGLRADQCTRCVISGNILNNNVMKVYQSEKSIVSNNFIQYPKFGWNTPYGISVKYSSHAVILDNKIYDTETGIKLELAQSNITIRDNHISGSGTYGIFAKLLTGSLVLGNRIEKSTNDGIKIEEGSYNIIKNNTIVYNDENGIRFVLSSQNIVFDNRIETNGVYGIHFHGDSLNNNISTNSICYNKFDVVDNNQVSNTGPNNTCEFNINYDDQCRYICPHLPVTSEECICVNCEDCSNKLIYSSSCPTIILTNSSLDHFTGSCISPPEKYGFMRKTLDCQGSVIRGDNSPSSGTIYGINVKGRYKVIVRNCTVRNFHRGIVVESSSFVTLENNYLFSNLHRYIIFLSWTYWYYGMYITTSEDVTVSDNTFSGNVLVVSNSDRGIFRNNHVKNLLYFSGLKTYYGMDFYRSDHCLVENNLLENFYYGAYFNDLENVTFINNDVADITEKGLYVKNTDVGEVSGNYVSYCGVGIKLEFSNSIRIWNNWLNSSTINAEDSTVTNQWSQGFVSFSKKKNNVNGVGVFGGNYWSDYTGVDENGNGIGDQAYLGIPSGDFFPLMPFFNTSIFRIRTSSLPHSNVGEFLRDEFFVFGGSGEYKYEFTLINGTVLVRGLEFVSNCLEGTPVEHGRFTFELNVTDLVFMNSISKIFKKKVGYSVKLSKIFTRKVGTRKITVPGRTLDYFMLLRNQDLYNPTEEFVLTERLDPWLYFVDSIPRASFFTPWSCVDCIFNKTIEWNVTLGPGETRLFRYRVYLRSTLPSGIRVRGPCDLSNDPVAERMGLSSRRRTLKGFKKARKVWNAAKKTYEVVNLAKDCLSGNVYGCADGVMDQINPSDGITDKILDFWEEHASKELCRQYRLTRWAMEAEGKSVGNGGGPCGDCNADGESGRPRDPNIKITLEPMYIKSSQVIHYIIQAENIGQTEAKDIFLLDDLPTESLDISTILLFRIGQNESNITVTIENGGTEVTIYDVERNQSIIIDNITIYDIVHEEWTVKLNHGWLNFTLTNIYLPPNGTTQVIYSVQPFSYLSSGTIVSNTVYIQFENFEIINTTAINVIDNSIPTCNILNASAIGRNLTFSYSVQDEIGEIDTIIFYLSNNGSAMYKSFATWSKTEIGGNYSFINMTIDDFDSSLDGEISGFFENGSLFITVKNSSISFSGKDHTNYSIICVAKDTAGNMGNTIPSGDEIVMGTCDNEDVCSGQGQCSLNLVLSSNSSEEWQVESSCSCFSGYFGSSCNMVLGVEDTRIAGDGSDGTTQNGLIVGVVLGSVVFVFILFFLLFFYIMFFFCVVFMLVLFCGLLCSTSTFCEISCCSMICSLCMVKKNRVCKPVSPLNDGDGIDFEMNSTTETD